MDKKFFCELDSFQVLGLLYKIRELQEKIPDFNDTIADNFKNQAINRSGEILKTPNIILKLFPSKAKYTFSKSMIDYLNLLTETDVFDDNNYEEYIEITMKLEQKKLLLEKKDIKE